MIKITWTCLLCIFSAQLFAQDYFKSFNRFSPVERASSHGVGVNLGSGMENIELKNDDGEKTTKTATRAWITKGVFWPLDVGLGLASLEEAQSFSGYFQYTLYEAFQTPAFAIRGSHSQIINSKTEDLKTSNLQFVTSWGYRVISLWASAGYSFHQQETTEPLGEWTRDVGLYWHVFPPYIAISGELKTAQYSPQSKTLKLSVGI